MTPAQQPVMTLEETKEGLLAIKEMMDAEQLRSHKDHGENMAEFKQISAPISAALHHLEAGKRMRDALNFIRHECDWKECTGDGGGDDRIGPACDQALAPQPSQQEGQ
jgi:hypothetical protein